MDRRTKIVATLGPATDNPQTLENLLLAGANLVRLNFSHGDLADQFRRAEMVQQISSRCGLNVAILVDLQGPKIRIARFREGSVQLARGDSFILDNTLANDQGDQQTAAVWAGSSGFHVRARLEGRACQRCEVTRYGAGPAAVSNVPGRPR